MTRLKPIAWLFLSLLVITGLVGLYYAFRTPTIVLGETVTDPGSDGHGGGYGYYSKEIGADYAMEKVGPLNWHEIEESQKVWTYGWVTGTKFLGDCSRVFGAQMTALEQVEEEVLVKYSYNWPKLYSSSCPSGVVFWTKTEYFQNANSNYKIGVKNRAEREEENRAKETKEQKKEAAVRRHVSTPPPINSTSLAEPPEADRPRRGPALLPPAKS